MGTLRDRYREVVTVLARHGWGVMVGATGVGRWVPRGMRGPEQPAAERAYTAAEHLRLALEELGVTFIKFGQMLSSRSDLLPDSYLTELAKLQDGAPPVPSATIRRQITEELGATPEDLFAVFDDAPLASASIGQAHVATRHDGVAVVVKVRRPGVVAQVQEDLEILQNIATQASRAWDVAADYDLVGVTQEFSRTLRAELDYLQEGRNAERITQNFAADPDIRIPQVYWETTSSRVLTLERLDGLKIDDLEGLDAAGIDRRDLAYRAVGAVAQMIFEDGFFHADPHAGNLFIESEGRIGLIDFGMVGEIDDRLRRQLAKLMVALSRADPDRIVSALLSLSTSAHSVDRAQLRADLRRIIAMYRGRSLGELNVSSLIYRVLALMRDHRLQMPHEIALIVKMVVMVEGLGTRLDPEFQVGKALEPHIRRMARHYLNPLEYARTLGQAGLDAAELSVELPGILQRIVDNVDREGLGLHIRTSELEPLVDRAEYIGNRLIAGMITAAFIRGVGQVVVADQQRFHRWSQTITGVGLGAAGSLGVYLALTARRRKQ